MKPQRKHGRTFRSASGKPTPKPTGKGVPKSIRIGQRGINVIERVVEDMGHLWTPTRPSSDAGTDGFVELCDPEGRATGQIVQIQSKATLGQFQNENEKGFDFLCDERDLTRWMEGNAPFVLVVSRPPGEAYWIPIKNYFADPAVRAARLVHFNKTANAFAKESSDALRNLAVDRATGIYTQTAARRDETLFSNLVPVGRYAPQLYSGATEFRDGASLAKELQAHVDYPRHEWFLKEGRIFSFHDLAEHPWAKVCDVGTVERFAADDWGLSRDRERMNDFIRLLGESLRDHLGRRGVKFYKRRKGVRGYYFFKPNKDLSARVVRWHALQKDSERTVADAYKSKLDPTRVAYHRHLAFVPRFRRFGGQWYLEITPTYHFTKDGTLPDRYGEERLSKIKRIEKNAAVFGNTLFWARFLCASDDFFRKGNEFIRFADIVEFNVDFGVNDSEWMNQAEDQEKVELEREGGKEMLLNL